MQNFKHTILLLLALAGILCSCSLNRPGETDFVVLYTEGLYNYVFPYNFKTGEDHDSQANFMTLVRQQRDIYQDHCLVFDGGNRLMGSLPSRYTLYVDSLSEPVSFKADRIVGYDATGIGGTDLENDVLLNAQRWNPEIQAPVVCANLLNRKNGQPLFKPYVILERDGVRIAVLGMTSPSEAKWLAPGLWKRVEVQDMIECAQQWMPVIKAEKPDLIIGMFNCNMNYEDRNEDIDSYKNPNGGIPAAVRVPGFDLLLLGNTPKNEVRTIVDDEGRHVTCMTVGEAAHYCGYVRIHMSKQFDGSYQKRIFVSVPEITQYEPDREFMEQLKPEFNEIYRWMHTPVGYLNDTIIGWEGLYGADRYREFINKVQMWYVPEADISMSSCSMGKDTIFPGPVTPFVVQKLYPFENTLRTIYMTGDDIVRMLEWVVNQQFETMTSADSEMLRLHRDQKGHLLYDDDGVPRLENQPAYFSSIRGIRYQVDLSKNFGSRVKVLSMSDGSPFVPNKQYLMALNSHLSLGGGGLFRDGLGWDEEIMSLHIKPRQQKSIRFVMLDYLQAMSSDTVYAEKGDNWEILPAAWYKKACGDRINSEENLPRW